MTSVTDLLNSELATLAASTWGGGRFVASRSSSNYDATLVADIYHRHILGGGAGPAAATAAHRHDRNRESAAAVSPRQVLEYSSYLEYYLWPFFSPSVSSEHVLSMLAMVNEKAREGVSLWGAFGADGSAGGAEAVDEKFALFFTRMLLLRGEPRLTLRERTAHTQFLGHAFASLENERIRKHVLRLVSLPLWLAMSPSRVDLELDEHPTLRKAWARVLRDHAAVEAAPSTLVSSSSGGGRQVQPPFVDGAAASAAASASAAAAAPSSVKRRRMGDDAAALPADVAAPPSGLPTDPSALSQLQKRLDAAFIPSLLSEFLTLLENIPPAPVPVPGAMVRLLERLCELFVDLLCQLPTRRFLRTLMDDCKLLLRARRSELAARSPGNPSPLTAVAATDAGRGKAPSTAAAAAAARQKRTVSGGLLVPRGTGSSRSSSSSSSSSGSLGSEGSLFTQLLDLLHFFLGFEIDDHTGTPLSEADVIAGSNAKLQVLQRLAYKHYAIDSREMRAFALGAVGPLANRAILAGHLRYLAPGQLTSLAQHLRLLPVGDAAPPRVEVRIGAAALAQLQLQSAALGGSGSGGQLQPQTGGKRGRRETDVGAAAAASAAAAEGSGDSSSASRAIALSSVFEALLPPSSAGSSIVALKPAIPLYSQLLLGNGDGADTSPAASQQQQRADSSPVATSTSAATAQAGRETAASASAAAASTEFVLDVLLTAHERRVSQIGAINTMPLYPNEALLWDPNLVPAGRFSGDGVLALPKLNLQFLTFYDYLLRSFTLYRLESAYEIRGDLVDAIKRTAPRCVTVMDANGYPATSTRFTGWSRMALPLLEGGSNTASGGASKLALGGPGKGPEDAASGNPCFRITGVSPPRVGEEVPARVTGEFRIDVGKHAGYIRDEWDSLREHDIVFLLTIRCEVPIGTDPNVWWREQEEKREATAAAAAAAASAAAASSTRRAAAAGDAGDDDEGADTSESSDRSRVQLEKQQPTQQQQHQQHSRPQQATAGGGGGGGKRGPTPRSSSSVPDEEDFTFPYRYGVIHVRGAEVYELKDERGEAMNDPHARPEERGRKPVGARRTVRVLLDPAQYHTDTLSFNAGEGEDVYASFNLVVRRRGEENNFKAVLATIRDVMNAAATPALSRTIPTWLHDVFLGYGDPGSAHYSRLPSSKQARDVDFGDTFVSGAHALASFPGAQVEVCDEVTGKPLDPAAAAFAQPPFRVRFEHVASSSSSGGASDEPSTSVGRVMVIPYNAGSPGPYPEDQPKRNPVPFTPVQIEAIRSGLNPGLTLVVGPPGTGKTDVAVQVISNLYHNYPQQRILMVAHSNQALNDLFEKLMERDIAEHHLLRLGAGERELATTKDFSKWGRVNYALTRRLALLAEVERLAVSIGVPADVGYTAETAEYFNLYHIASRVEQFRAKFNVPAPPSPSGSVVVGVDSSAGPAGSGFASYIPASSAALKSTASAFAADERGASPAALAAAQRLAYTAQVEIRMAGVGAHEVFEAFPFAVFFSTAPGGLEAQFPPNASSTSALASAEAAFAHLDRVFSELASFRAFELLRSQHARTDYMLTKQARIVAMTCTHAALTRAALVELGFKYDTLVMEEAAQVLEIETFVPMVLQTAAENEGPRLKRVILIGDHHQLPPVVKNMALQKFGRLDQSLFTRFVRLGVPAVELNMQGRARPSLAQLYNWRYKSLGDLPNLALAASSPSPTPSPFSRGNGGFVFDYQLIDVPDYHGKGESTPLPHFYQNLGEAEYIVALYQYMRLVGYASSSIAILTTYNGQKALIRDILRRRCAPYAVFGEPLKVETVDKFQGQQADVVLLSLVRTVAVGHLRDVRRLVVAMSRARFGLYAVGRAGLFSNCLELLPAFTKLTERPSKLKLLVGEQHPTPRGANEALPDVLARAGGALAEVEVQGVEHLGAVVTQILTAQMSMAGAAAAAAAAAAAGASSDAVTAAGGPSAAAFVGAEEEEDGSRGLDIEPSGADAVPGDEEGDGEQ